MKIRLWVLIAIALAAVAITVRIKRATPPSPEYSPPPARVTASPPAPLLPPPPDSPWLKKMIQDSMPRPDKAVVDRLSPGQFRVSVLLEPGALPGEAELAQEVKRMLEKAKPDNPGRQASFPYWQIARSTESPPVPLVHLGWRMIVDQVRNAGSNGWRAHVRVYPVTRLADGRSYFPSNHHVEWYRLLSGKLELTGEAVDPSGEVERGLSGLFGRHETAK